MMSKALDLIAIPDTQCHISAYLGLIGRCNLPFAIWYPEDLTSFFGSFRWKHEALSLKGLQMNSATLVRARQIGLFYLVS